MGRTTAHGRAEAQGTLVAARLEGRKHRGRGKRVSEVQPPPRIRAGHRIFLYEHGQSLFGPGTFDLLVLVDETGSLHRAAKVWRAMRPAEDHQTLMESLRMFLDEADADLARLYQKYFGDASFAQPAISTERSARDASR